MDSRNDAAAAAAAAPLPQYPAALLALPDLDRPPAIMETWELEAVAAALPAKKRRLRETFDRLAACAPAPLPFRWEDLDAHISSLQYSATLRRRQLRQRDTPLPAPAAVAPAPSTTGDDVLRQMRFLEESQSRRVPAPVPIPSLLAVSEPPAAAGDVVHDLRAPVPAPAAFSAPASPLQDVDCNGGEKSRPVAPPGPGDGDGVLAAEPNATAQVSPVPVGEIAVVPQELPGPDAARHGSNAGTNRAVRTRPRGWLPLQRAERSRPPRPIRPASAAHVAGIQEVDADAAHQKMQMQDADAMVVVKNTSHDGGEANVSPRRGAHASGNGLPTTAAVTTQAGVNPIGNVTGVQHEPPSPTPNATSAASPPKVNSFSLLKVPKQEEVPDVEMEIVEAEDEPEPKQEHAIDEAPDVEMEIVEETEETQAPVADEKASSPLQANAHQEADKVSPLPLACSNGGHAQEAGAPAAATAQLVDAAGAAVGESSPAAVTGDAAKPVHASSSDLAVPGREATGPSAANKHVLQQQHMFKQNQSFPRNHGGRPPGSRPVPEAQAAAQKPWKNKPGGFAAGRNLQGDHGSKNKGYYQKGKPFIFCNKCGCKGHLAENCRTAKHLVGLYLKAKEEEAKQICYRCGCTGHWSRKCRTPKHLVDLYQKDQAAKREARDAGLP